MKKLISILTAIIIVIAVCGIAAADPATLSTGGTAGTNAGTALATSVKIAKTIKVFNPDTLTVNGPTISYSYTITGVTGGSTSKTITDEYGVQATTQTPPAIPTLTGTGTNTIAWTTVDQLNASPDGVDSTKYLTIDFSGVTFTAQGVYRYKITEETYSADDYAAAGVTDGTISDERYLDVYVREAQTGETGCQIYGYVLLSYDNIIDGQSGATANTVAHAVKTTGFVASTDYNGTALTSDEYHTSNVTVSKELVGDSAMNSHKFPFHISFTNTTVTASVRLKKQVVNTTAADLGSAAGALNAATDYQLLANGESVKYIGIPAGTTVSAYETNDVLGTTYSSAATVSDTTSGGSNADAKSISGGTAHGSYTAYDAQTWNSNPASVVTTETSANYTESFVNTLELISPTGYIARYAPYALILAAGMILLSLLLVKKHRRHADKE